MGAPAGTELANVIASGNFTGSSQSSTAALLLGVANLTIWGTFTATVLLVRSFDGGTTWVPVARDSSGTNATFTAPTSLAITERERGVLYQLQVTAYSSGTINYRLSVSQNTHESGGIV